MLHAGSVTVHGLGVVFVGQSGAGKSTLTAAMVLAGHGYIADEVAAIASDTTIRAFHRPIGLRSAGATALGLCVPPGPFELTYPLRVGDRAPLAAGVPLSRIFIIHRKRAASSVEVAALTPIEPAQALVRLTNCALARGAGPRYISTPRQPGQGTCPRTCPRIRRGSKAQARTIEAFTVLIFVSRPEEGEPSTEWRRRS